MNLEQVKKAESKLLLATYDRYPVLLHKGNGVHVFDDKGRKYLDFLSGIGVNALGHNHPVISKTIARQAKLLIHTSNLFYHEYQARLAAALTKISGMDRAFFTNSGTEAWEGALKVARAYAKSNAAAGSEPKWRILALEHAFHGRTFGALATTHKEKYRAPFTPVVPGVEFVKFNDVHDLEQKFDSTVCAIGFEFVQGEGGIRPVSREFAAKARELANKHGALLIADEIQSGMGRTGKWFGYQHYGIPPDMVTVAKPIAGGLPLGALLLSEKASQCIHPGMHGTTFGGGPLACSVALELIKVIEKQKLLKHVQKTGDYMATKLNALKKKHPAIIEIRGLGLMVGVEFESADLAKAAFQSMLEQRVILNRTDETVLRFLPPFIVKKKHVDEVIEKLDQALSSQAKKEAAVTTASRRTR
ncbi:MAG TPA: aspartate aminotransferase family protein [Candidatus Limnocylindrales bacterium]|nr:aspartate aminotransferase family protein [Candidatus Limnocylindrales bacterium]